MRPPILFIVTHTHTCSLAVSLRDVIVERIRLCSAAWTSYPLAVATSLFLFLFLADRPPHVEFLHTMHTMHYCTPCTQAPPVPSPCCTACPRNSITSFIH